MGTALWGEYRASGYYDRREQWGPLPAMTPQRPYKPGAGFQCGGYRHIAKFCSGLNRLYPFSQPVVSSNEVYELSPGLEQLSLCCGSVISRSITPSVCVNELVGIDQVMSKEGADGQSHDHASDDKGTYS